MSALPPRAGYPAPAPAARAVSLPSPGALTLTHTGRDDQAVAFMVWPTLDFFADPQKARDLRMLQLNLRLRLIDERDVPLESILLASRPAAVAGVNTTLLLTAPPYFAAFICSLCISFHAAHRQERGLHIAVPLTFSLLGNLLVCTMCLPSITAVS